MSTKCEWSGDVDLGDGSVQKQYADYLARIERVNGLSFDKQKLVHEMCTIFEGGFALFPWRYACIVLVRFILYTALKKADDEYKEKLSSSDKASSDNELCWTVDKLVRLLE